ncbi:MAG TPA: ATP-binding protein [Candidatus Subteraquimicrobiales bacterium]
MRQLLKRISPKRGILNQQDALSTNGNQPLSGKIAVYDSMSLPPKITEITAGDPIKMTEVLTRQTHEFLKKGGGTIPRAVVKEVFENLIHASFKDVVVSILNNGNTVRIADHGPGIKDKKRALEPGFSTATPEIKKVIRGVGSGLATVKETMNLAGGKISLENNLGKGLVITLSLPPKVGPSATVKESSPIHLSKRQKTVLSLVMEIGVVGPAGLAQELEISLSSAYRDLTFLEKRGLVKSNGRGQRSLTQEGISFLDIILTS